MLLSTCSVCSLLSSVPFCGGFTDFFIHSLIEGHLYGFQKYSCVGFCMNTCFHFSWVNILGTGLLGLMISTFNFIRNSQTVFQKDWIILHFQQQNVRVPVVLHLHQLQVLSDTLKVKSDMQCSSNLHFLNDK